MEKKNEMMTQEKIIEELNEVLQIDIDAAGGYEAAVKSIDQNEIKQQLLRFKGDHERHITDLRAIVQRMGGAPVEHADLKGLAAKGITRIAGLIGNEAVLRAMLQNEKVSNSTYAHHVQKTFPPDILDVLRRNYGDEQRHYSGIESALRQRLWEQPTAPATP